MDLNMNDKDIVADTEPEQQCQTDNRQRGQRNDKFYINQKSNRIRDHPETKGAVFMKKSIAMLGMVLMLAGCAAAESEPLAAEPAALVEISPATEETAQTVEAAETANPAQTATPAPTQDPIPMPTAEPTPAPTVAPTAAPTQAPVEESVADTPAMYEHA